MALLLWWPPQLPSDCSPFLRLGGPRRLVLGPPAFSACTFFSQLLHLFLQSVHLGTNHPQIEPP